MPFQLVAVRENGREGKYEDILDRIFYGCISCLIDLLHEVHAILQTDEVMLEGEAFCLIGQGLDGAEDGGPGGQDFLWMLHKIIHCSDDVHAKAMPDWITSACGIVYQKIGSFFGIGFSQSGVPE